jgi:hypothetical protein
MQIADRCAPVKVANSAENSVLQALQFHQMSVRRKLPGGTGIIISDLISALYMIYLMFAFKCLFLNIEYVLMYVPKALAAIFSMRNIDTIYKWDVPFIQLKVVPRHSTSIR